MADVALCAVKLNLFYEPEHADEREDEQADERADEQTDERADEQTVLPQRCGSGQTFLNWWSGSGMRKRWILVPLPLPRFRSRFHEIVVIS